MRAISALCLSVAFLALMASNTMAADADAVRKPNIIFIVGDDMGYADISAHGCQDIATPNIDSLAANGVRCTQGYVSGCYCSPTRAGLMTGRYQQRFGHEFNLAPQKSTPVQVGLPRTETTIAERLQTAGYATGLVGKWHLGSSKLFIPNARGFASFFGFPAGAGHAYFPDSKYAKNPHYDSPIYRNEEVVEEKSYLTTAFGREAVAFIDAHKAEPFFLYVAFNAVHNPNEAPKKYEEKFAHIADAERRSYVGMMTSMDDAVGKILAKLKKEKLLEDTLICFISDNGGPANNGSSNGKLRGYKAQTWEGGIRVPFLVQWKGHLPKGKVYDEPVIQLDLTATALATAGALPPLSAKLDGVDLMPYLDGKTEAPPHVNLYWRFGPQMAIRQGNYKLVKGPGESAKKELFDLAKDPNEKNDLAAAEPETVAKLQATYDAWNAELVEPLWRPKGDPGEKMPVDED